MIKTTFTVVGLLMALSGTAVTAQVDEVAEGSDGAEMMSEVADPEAQGLQARTDPQNVGSCLASPVQAGVVSSGSADTSGGTETAEAPNPDSTVASGACLVGVAVKPRMGADTADEVDVVGEEPLEEPGVETPGVETGVVAQSPAEDIAAEETAVALAPAQSAPDLESAPEEDSAPSTETVSTAEDTAAVDEVVKEEPAPAVEPAPAKAAPAQDPEESKPAPKTSPKPAPKPAPEPKPEKKKARPTPPSEPLKAWWPQPKPDALNLLFAGDASFGRAIALFFDQEFEGPESANEHIKVMGPGGKSVDGSWLVSSNPKMLLFKAVPGTYQVEILEGLTAKDDKKLGASSKGIVYIP